MPKHSVGDVLEGGRVVKEVDDEGNVLVVSKKKGAPQPPTERTETEPLPDNREVSEEEEIVAPNPQETEEDVEEESEDEAAPKKRTPKKAPKAKPAAVKKPKAPARPRPKKGGVSAPKGHKWTTDIKKQYLSDIKNNRETYASIAAKLGIRPQTVWASLNRKNKR